MMSSVMSAGYFEFVSEQLDWRLLVFTLFLASIGVLASVFLKYALRRKSISKKIPCRPVTIFDVLGNLRDIQTLNEGFSFNVAILQLIAGYIHLFRQSKIFCFWISYVPFYIVTKAEVLEDLLINSKSLKKNWSYDFLLPWLGTGLLISDGKKWKSRRKLLTPSFHFDILKEFLPIFNQQSEKLIGSFKNGETSKDFTDIVMPVTLCSLDIICETTLGVKINAQEDKDSKYVQAVLRQANVMAERMLNCKYWLDGIFKFTEAGRQQKKDLELLHDFTRSVIKKKKEKLMCMDPEQTERKKRKALMDVLLEHHVRTKELSEEDIREEVDTFTFEGHDTTSMGISWALYLVGLYKDVQETIHQEIDRIFGSDRERQITMEDLKDMKYLECVLKESQRLYPSVPFFAREMTDDIKISGFTLPKGSSCSVVTFCLHRDESVYPNPEVFDPDRFLPENSANRHPFAYIPFSAGPRNCIGQRFAMMEEKVVLSNILRHFTLESLDERDKLIPAAELILRAPAPIRIKIRPRN